MAAEDVFRSREVAESAREKAWRKESFLKALFLGTLRMDLIDPYPLPENDRPEFRAFYDALKRFLEDVVDCAIASMSGLTSQPSLDAVAAALMGSERDPGVDLDRLQELSDDWEAVRTWYAPFESGLRASTADVYWHEIPGGQYSNLKPQALAVGLADQWNEVRERYREVNFAFGDIIKVTPSSKVVGDFALWLVRNNLTVEKLMESDFMLNGQPRSVLVEDKRAAEDRPKRRKADPGGPGEVGAPMPGTVLNVAVAVGEEVSEGDALGVVEAIKLETTVRAPVSGKVAEVLVGPKDRVESGDLLFVLEAG